MNYYFIFYLARLVCDKPPSPYREGSRTKSDWVRFYTRTIYDVRFIFYNLVANINKQKSYLIKKPPISRRLYIYWMLRLISFFVTAVTATAVATFVVATAAAAAAFVATATAFVTTAATAGFFVLCFRASFVNS